MSLLSAMGLKQSQKVEQIAHSYLRATKGWKEEEYQLEFLRQEVGASCPVVVLDAVHESDLQMTSRGPSRSAQLYIDPEREQVVRELAFQ